MTDSAANGRLGKYANHFTVGSNYLEVVIDFGQWYEGDEAQLHTRIVTSPRYAMKLMQLLAEALEEHQARHGVLRPD
jgi:hypothetical protein